jgi:hypothetical protein
MMEEGKKFDGDKARVDLVDPLLIESCANALGHGVEKYGEHNWRLGLKQSRVYGALIRHLGAYWKGENLDDNPIDGSGLSHLDHAAAMLMMLIRYHKDDAYEEFDDRYMKPQEEYADLAPSDSERPTRDLTDPYNQF